MCHRSHNVTQWSKKETRFPHFTALGETHILAFYFYLRRVRTHNNPAVLAHTDCDCSITLLRRKQTYLKKKKKKKDLSQPRVVAYPIIRSVYLL